MWTTLLLFALGCSGRPGPDGGGQTDAPCTEDRDCATGYACSADGECAPIPETCGDGDLDGAEVCDGAELNGATCLDLVGYGGELACLGDCSGYDTSGCTCVAATCEGAGAECGPVDDGCGGTLDCGGCGGWLECGFAEDNVCGAGCPEDCPAGAACSDLGVCEGADLGDLALDLQTVRVAGSVTLDGATPTDLAGCSGPTDSVATVTFLETTQGYAFSTVLYCGGGYTFGPLTVTPGTYDVIVAGDPLVNGDTNLPEAPYVALTALSVQADTPGLVLPVQTVDVSGAVTLNGANPLDLAGCTDGTDAKATVTFVETTHGYTFPVTLFCGGGYTFGPVAIYPGTYDVIVAGDPLLNNDTNLPEAPFTALENVAVLVDTAGLTLAVATVNVSGTVTLNGAAPMDLPGCTDPTDAKATITFRETTHGYTFPVTLFCGGGYGFGPVAVYPGTYDVTVAGDPLVNADTTLPEAPYVAVQGVVLAANTAGLVLPVTTVDVSGTITLDGVAPVDLPGCTDPTDAKATVTFRETTHGYTFPITLFCGGGYSFPPTAIYPGTYDVTVAGDLLTNGDTNLPEAPYVALDDVVIAADTAGLLLAVETVDVSGAITLNGGAPMDLPGCTDPTDAKATVTFRETTYGYTFPVTLYCGEGYGFGPVAIYPGTYDVIVAGDPLANGDTNLPEAPFVAASGVAILADTAGLVLPVETVEISGSLTLNGVLPTELAGCSGATDNAAAVTFTEVERGYVFPVTVFCDTGFTFGPISVYPGIYEVRVAGDATDTNLPGTSVVVVSRLAVP